MSASINFDALMAWLAAHPPQTLLTYIDRLLIATVGDLDERPALVARSGEMLAYISELTEKRFILSQVTDVLVLLALLEEEGAAMGQCRLAVEAVLPVARILASSWAEPFRSTFFYWQARAGLGPPLMVGADPHYDILRLYHTTHRVLFAANYGLQAVQRAPFDEALRACDPVLYRQPNNGDAFGEMLLVEAMLVPRNEMRCDLLRGRLAELQRPDGAIAMPAIASPEAVHHAACVAVLAERLLKHPPPATEPEHFQKRKLRRQSSR